MRCKPVISQIHSVVAGMDAPIHRFFRGFVRCVVSVLTAMYMFSPISVLVVNSAPDLGVRWGGMVVDR